MIVTLLFISTFLISRSTALSFTCNNGTTISASRFCDATLDCDDGSDEIVNNLDMFEEESTTKIGCPIVRITENAFMVSPPCSIDRGYFCNGSVACLGLDPCDVGCPQYYRCNDNTCVKRSTVFDGDPLNGCKEEDGWQSGIGFQCVRNGDYCLILQQLLWDGVQGCDQGEDLCYIINANNDGRKLHPLPLTSLNQSRCFKCLDQSMIVPRHKVCDGVMDCSDLSDECLCDEEVPEICQNLVDLEATTNKLRSPTSCEVRQITCGDGSCIERSSVCDSVGDCYDNRDERFSYCRGTLQCNYGKLEDQSTECRERFRQNFSYGGFCLPQSQMVEKLYKNTLVCFSLPAYLGVVSSFSTFIQRCKCDATHINVVGVVCDGNDDCPVPAQGGTWAEPPGYPADECNAECSNQPAFNCTKRLFGANGIAKGLSPCLSWGKDFVEGNYQTPPRPVIYSGQEKCNGILKCTASGEDEADCPNRFRCPAGRLISIPRSQVCDGIEDCDGKTDENNVTCPHRFFCKSRSTKVSIAPELVCDFNINCDDNSDETNCSLAERFYCESGNPLFVERRLPFKAALHRNVSVVFVLIGIVWLVAFSLALLPLSSNLEYTFIEYAVLRQNPFFRNVTVSFDSAKSWASKLFYFDPSLSSSANVTLTNIDTAKNWNKLQEALGNSYSSSYLQTSSYLGYHSANSVCIPRLFVTKQDKSWHFSLAITVFNFLAFCYVAIAYLSIFFHQRKNASKKTLSLSREKSNKRLQALQGKVFRLILTDFCCWVPIAIMSFFHFNEGNLPSVAYVASAIVLLPINSALNPLLYSDFIDKLFAKAKKSLTSSQTVPMTPTSPQATTRDVLGSVTKF